MNKQFCFLCFSGAPFCFFVCLLVLSNSGVSFVLYCHKMNFILFYFYPGKGIFLGFLRTDEGGRSGERKGDQKMENIEGNHIRIYYVRKNLVL